MPVIQCDNLSVRYRQTLALDGINFAVEPGDYIGIVGPNGSGKTTLIKTMLGLMEPESGTVEIMGKVVCGYQKWQEIGYLPQATTITNKSFPASVVEVVATGLLGGKTFPRRVSVENKQQVRDILSILEIDHLHDEQIGSLSGGQTQRVLLARAMVASPAILILDEPTAALDPSTREHFYETIARLNREQGTTILLITHDSGTIGKYASKMLYLDHKLIFYGSFTDFCHSSDMAQYFGDASQHLMCHQH
jgi:zinc transport system ATP-binding protein